MGPEFEPGEEDGGQEDEERHGVDVAVARMAVARSCQKRNARRVELGPYLLKSPVGMDDGLARKAPRRRCFGVFEQVRGEVEA